MKDVTRLFDIPAYQLEKYPIENALVTICREDQPSKPCFVTLGSKT